MLRINKRISNELIKEYIENALNYFNKKIKNENIDINLQQNKEEIVKLLTDIDFKNIYDNVLSKINNYKDLFTYITHHKNGTTSEESIYDNFKTKTLLSCNKKKNKGVIANSSNKEIDENDKKVVKLYKDFIKELDIKVCPYCGRNHTGYLELNENEDNSKIATKEKNYSQDIPSKDKQPWIATSPSEARNDGFEKNIESLEAKEIEENTVTIAPSLDHFYPKSLYRQFSISLYNLIPACNLCNLTLKHDRNETNLLYPYKEGFEEYVKFNLGNNSEKDLMKVVMLLTGDSTVDTSDLEIKLVKDVEKIIKEKSNNNWIATHLEDARNDDFVNFYDNNNINDYNSKIPLSAKADIPLYERGCLVDDGFIDRCKNSNRMFHIEEIYNSEHKQNALDLISMIVWYRKNYFKSLGSILPLFEDCSEQKTYCSTDNQLFSFIGYSNKLKDIFKNKVIKKLNNWIATHLEDARSNDDSVNFYDNNNINDYNSKIPLSAKADIPLYERGYKVNDSKYNIDIIKSIIKANLKEVIKIIDIDDLLGEKFDFLFGRWLDSDNDLKEPLSKFYRDIYKQITEPNLYELLE